MFILKYEIKIVQDVLKFNILIFIIILRMVRISVFSKFELMNKFLVMA